MPKFLIQASFNQEAAKRLIEDGGTKRAAAVRELLRQQEARLESLYFSPQNDGPDAFAIIEVPVRRRCSRGYRSGWQNWRHYAHSQADIYARRIRYISGQEQGRSCTGEINSG